MKRSTIVFLMLVMIVGALSMVGATAGHCGTGGRNADDPFGSCENTTGTKCGAGTSIVVATLIVDQNKGVEGCSDSSDALPIKGRVGVWRNADGGATVFIDGSDGENAGALGGWQRYDVRPNASSCKVQARRGTGGTWNDGTANGTSNPDSLNQCAG